MLDQLTDQLRRYGDAVEEHLLQREDHPLPEPRRQRYPQLASIAAALALLVIGGVALWTRDNPRSSKVATRGSETSQTSAPPAGATITLAGTATWTGLDPRSELRVAACPQDDVARACPSMRSTAVADDGTFTLNVPSSTDPSLRWDVVAYVPATKPSCVFNCAFPEAPRNAVLGERVTVTPASASQELLSLDVSARVIDVLVRDRNGQPFDGGGVQVTDARCTEAACPTDIVPMFVRASVADGAVRLVLAPEITYVIHGQATNTGWPDPAWTNEGNTFWFSPDVRVQGNDLSDGFVFTVDGAPATSGT